LMAVKIMHQTLAALTTLSCVQLAKQSTPTSMRFIGWQFQVFLHPPQALVNLTEQHTMANG
jgi:hypothetical protein